MELKCIDYKALSHETPSHENFLKLFKELIDIYSSHSSVSREAKRKHNSLRSHLYSVLYFERPGKETPYTLSDVEKILWYSHTLYKKRKFDDAYKLKSNLKLMTDNGLLQNHNFRNVIRFLTNLIDCDITEPKNGAVIPGPWISSSVKEINILPKQPLCYNDTRLDSAFSRWHYTHFPSDLFCLNDSSLNIKSGSLKDWSIENFMACDKEPGLDHHFNFFRKDDSEAATSCFGALTGPRRLKSPITPDTPLSIPSLPCIPDGYSFIHTLSYRRNISESSQNQDYFTNNECDRLTVDEGYVSSQCSDSGNSPPRRKEDIWDQVLREGFGPKKLSWERLNHCETSFLKPFISEAGDSVTQRIRSVEHHFESTIDSNFTHVNYFEIPLSQLCQEILHMLTGIPTSNFYLDQDSRVFRIREGLCYQGITPETLRPLLEEFIHCGNKVLRLEEFSVVSNNEDQVEKLSVKSFKKGIVNFLFYYRQMVMLFLGETKILSLKMKSEPLRRKINYVYKICFEGLSQEHFTNGLNLIGDLSNEFISTRCPSNLYLLLSFLNSACKPFLLFIEKWIYEGEFCDPGSEFMVKRDEKALRSESRLYWTQGHVLCHDFEEIVPDFLRDVLRRAFLCGKSLNLLKECCPHNFLLMGQRKYPGINLCSSLNQVLLKKIQCQKYFSYMKNISSFSMLTLEGLDHRKKQKEDLLMKTASDSRIRHLLRFRKIKDEETMRESKIKQERFEMLKEDLKKSAMWKEKRREETAREEEKRMLEERIREEEAKFAELKERSTFITNYEEEMRKLKFMENSLQTQIQELKLDLNIKRENFKKSEIQSSIPKDSQENDTESESQMSTTSDALDTPNDDLISAVSPHQSKNTIMDAMKEIITCENNNNEIENSQSTDSDEANSNIRNLVTPISLNKVSDALNRNNLFPRGNLDTEGNAGNELMKIKENSALINDSYENINELLNKDLKEEKDERKLGKIVRELTSELKNSTAGETIGSNKITDRYELEKNDNGSCISSALTSKRTKLEEITVDEMNNIDGNVKNLEVISENEGKLNSSEVPNPCGELFKLRKSKSESLSLKDPRNEVKRKKNIDRFSLHSMHSEEPVLIDEVIVYGNVWIDFLSNIIC